MLTGWQARVAACEPAQHTESARPSVIPWQSQCNESATGDNIIAHDTIPMSDLGAALAKVLVVAVVLEEAFSLFGWNLTCFDFFELFLPVLFALAVAVAGFVAVGVVATLI